MARLYDRIKNKRIAVFGTGILQADLFGLFRFDRLFCYISDASKPVDDAMLEDAPVLRSDVLLHEKKNDIFIIVCEEDESYAQRRLESMGFAERRHFCHAEELLLEYALGGGAAPKPTRIWGTGSTFRYHHRDLAPYMPAIRSFIVSDMDGESATLADRPVEAIGDYTGDGDDFILVCSVYYKDIGKQLTKRGLTPGRQFMNIRTFVKMLKFIDIAQREHVFHDRSRGAESMVVILAGYKAFAWESVFPRLKAVIPEEFDVVIATSGLLNEELRKLAARNHWSYLATAENQVSLALNVTVLHFPEAKFIFKIDEDVIVTQGCFEAMAETHFRIGEESRFEIGFITPLLNVNGYGYVRLLELLGAEGMWETRFGPLKFTDCSAHHSEIRDSGEAAMFMWGKDNPALADIDAVAARLRRAPFGYSICPIRYSIGFILFTKQNWLRMQTFPMTRGLNLGADEEHICKFCSLHGRIIGVAENALAGHISYGPQHQAMEAYYRDNKDAFLWKG